MTERYMDNETMDYGDEIDDPVIVVPPSIMRVYFILLFVVVFVAVVALWRRVTTLDDGDQPLSLRGEMLSQVLLFLNVYAFAWLPLLFLGILDGELETASISEGFKGQVANTHCAIQDLMARSFCMIIVVSTTIYLRYNSDDDSHGCCMGRPNMFLWGMLVPVILVETTRFLLAQKEWLMPTQSIIRHLGPIPFSLKTTPVFCVQQIDESWLRQLMAEWFQTIMMVVAVAFCCFPCYRRQDDDDEEEVDSKSEDESQSQTNSPQPTDSSSAESTELQMEELLQTDSKSLQNSPSEEEEITSPDSTQPEPSESDPINISNDDASESEGLYARGGGFLEAVAFIGVVWAVTVRPFMAISLYALNDGTYSNYLDIPTHVLLIIATAIVPLELDCRSTKEKEEEEDEEERPGGRRGGGGGGGDNLNTEQDVNPLWKSDGEERSLWDPNGSKEDVDPLWSERRDEQNMENISNRENGVSESSLRESNLK